MTTHIDDAGIARLARLAKLKLDDSKSSTLRAGVDEIMGWIDILMKPELKDLEPMTSAVHFAEAHIRDDEVKHESRIGELTDRAPESRGGFILVPKVVE